MFRTLRIRNFRSIKDSGTVELGPLNIFIGPNNSGKSSILATLLMLKQSLQDKDFETGLVTSGPLIDLGSYFDIVPKSSDEAPLSVSFALDPSIIEQKINFGFTEPGELDTIAYDFFDLAFRYNLKRNNVELCSFRMRDSGKNREVSGDLKGQTWKLLGLPQDVAPH